MRSSRRNERRTQRRRRGRITVPMLFWLGTYLATVLGFAFGARPSPTEPAVGSSGRRFPTHGAAPSASVGPAGAPQRIRYHAPVLDGRCTECHDPENERQVRADILEQCQACHPRYFSAEVGHAPVRDGACFDCHSPHRSLTAGLLVQPVNQICAECHAEVESAESGFHAGRVVTNCTRCHDPHFGTGYRIKSGAPVAP